jgi:hypothetical protein
MTTLEIIIAHYEELSLEGSNQAYVVAKYLKKYLADEKAQLELRFKVGYVAGWEKRNANIANFLTLVSDEKSNWVEDLEYYNRNKERLDIQFEEELNRLINED